MAAKIAKRNGLKGTLAVNLLLIEEIKATTNS